MYKATFCSFVGRRNIEQRSSTAKPEVSSTSYGLSNRILRTSSWEAWRNSMMPNSLARYVLGHQPVEGQATLI